MAVSTLDFLEQPIEGGGVVREGSSFEVVGPWQLAQFGPHALKGGWWTFDCNGEADLSGVEVRLGSPLNPLIVAPGDAAETFRLHLQDGETWEVALLVSPWPGRYRFDQLRLRRLTLAEEMSLVAAGAGRLLRTDRPFSRLSQAAARVLSGKTVGVRTVEPTRIAPVVGRTESQTSAPDVTIPEGWTAAIDIEDRLHPRAIELVDAEFARSPEVWAVYADVCEGGEIIPHPQWDPELAKWTDLAGTPVFFRAHAGDPAPPTREALKQLIERLGPGAVRRIPLPLAERPARPRPRLPPVPMPRLERMPSVSVLVPTRFRVDLLESCLNGLAATDYPDLEAIVIDNGCTDPRFPDALMRAGEKLKLAKVEDFAPFNFSRLIHSGAAKASGEILVILNDDIEPTHPDWLVRMVDSALRPDVGAVGARLTFPDGSIQHAGCMMGLGGVCGHLWKGASAEEAERNPMIAYPGGRLAVTGACLAVRREVYDRVGGLDQDFAVALNDIDFCLRIHATGLRNIYRGDAVLIHQESQSRGMDDADDQRRNRLAAETARFLDRWKHMLADDPFGSPAFDPLQERGVVHRSLRGAFG